eukprot:jgi/Galph1/5598/GphlegSOOS_G4243.1
MTESTNETQESFVGKLWKQYLEGNRRLTFLLDTLQGKYLVPTKEEREEFVKVSPVYGQRLQTLRQLKEASDWAAVTGFAFGSYYSWKFSKSPLTLLLISVTSATGFYFLGYSVAETALGCHKFDRVEPHLQLQKFLEEKRAKN